MRIQNTLTVASIAAVALSSVASAQGFTVDLAGPVKHMNLDLATGVISPVADDNGSIQQLVNEVVTLDNTVQSGFFATTGTPDEWVDYGYTVGSSGPVCQFAFAYATREPDDIAAPPVSFTFAFYSNDAATAGNCDTTIYGGTGLGTEVARFTVAGLPGDTTPGDGIAEAYAFNVDLRGNGDGGFMLPEGGLAWSYEVGSDAAETGPLLMTPAGTGCSAPGLNAAPGTSDCFDIFAGNAGAGGGACVGTFGFATPDISSFWMEITQEEFPAPVATTRDNGTQTATMVAVNDRAILGCAPGTCPSVAITSAGSIIDFWALSRTSAPGIPIGFDGDLLIGLPEITILFGTAGSAGTPIEIGGIPVACDFVGIDIFTQGGGVDAAGTISLTNAVDYVLGTP